MNYLNDLRLAEFIYCVVKLTLCKAFLTKMSRCFCFEGDTQLAR